MASNSAIYLLVGAGLDVNRRDGLGMALNAALPLLAFVIANGIAELNGAFPVLFAPFGLLSWLGAALHIGSLPLFGLARWMVMTRGRDGRSVSCWLEALMAACVVFPFVVAPLDSLLLNLATMTLLLLGLAVALRVTNVSPQADLLMLPGLVWMRLSAFVGLSLDAVWSSSFGLINSQGHGGALDKLHRGAFLQLLAIRAM
ncbi:MAG: hypothetical protein MO846_00340 [Candidatus Devosia symbiotica]|nr:hypothetical protein [Candidatus Devosia symbiotica]